MDSIHFDYRYVDDGISLDGIEFRAEDWGGGLERLGSAALYIGQTGLAAGGPKEGRVARRKLLFHRPRTVSGVGRDGVFP